VIWDVSEEGELLLGEDDHNDWEVLTYSQALELAKFITDVVRLKYRERLLVQRDKLLSEIAEIEKCLAE
jgi:hypothetical protein